jgi:hypothetical protein
MRRKIEGTVPPWFFIHEGRRSGVKGGVFYLQFILFNYSCFFLEGGDNQSELLSHHRNASFNALFFSKALSYPAWMRNLFCEQ